MQIYQGDSIMGLKRISTGWRLFWLVFWSITWFAIVIGFWSVSSIVTGWIIQLLQWFQLDPIKLNPEIIKTLFNGLGTILLGIGPAVVFWYFRDETKHIDQDHTERDLQIKERDIKIKEDNDAWANFIKYQEMAEDESITEGRRAAAIFALGEYYRRGGSQFQQQVHVFFKKYLDKFWANRPEYNNFLTAVENYWALYSQKSSQSDTIEEIEKLENEQDELLEAIPAHIKAVHEVIKDKAQKIKFEYEGKKFNLFHRENNLELSEFNLTGAQFDGVNLAGAILRGANLTGATFQEANLVGTVFNEANLTGVKLNRANLTRSWFMYANLTSADLGDANITGAMLNDANLTGAELFNTNLTGSVLKYANFTEAVIACTNLTGATLYNTNLKGTRFHGVNLTDTALNGADLTGVQFGIADLAEIDPRSSFFVQNIIPKIFLKLFHPNKLGFIAKRFYTIPKYNLCLKYLHFLFIKWNFKPDFHEAKYDPKTTKLPKWLDPAKYGMIDISKEPEVQDVHAN